MIGTTIDLLLFGLAVVLLIRALHDWFTANPRAKRHVSAILLMVGLVVLQIDAVLPLSPTWRTVKAVASLAIFVSVMWYGTGEDSPSSTRSEG